MSRVSLRVFTDNCACHADDLGSRMCTSLEIVVVLLWGFVCGLLLNEADQAIA